MSFIYYVHSIYLLRETIANVTGTPDVTKRGMYAAKNPSSVTGLLLHTGKLLKGLQSTKMLLIMPRYLDITTFFPLWI